MRIALPTFMVLLALAGCGDDDTAQEGDGGSIPPDGSIGDAGGGSDSAVDEEDAGSCSHDDDCSDGVACTGIEQCVAGACVPGQPPPCTPDHACVEATGRCECSNPSQDGDFYDAIACGGDDCDDSDPDIHPDAVEVCGPGGDDINEDCDYTSYQNELTQDGDGDGDLQVSAACFNRAPDGTHVGGEDCDDTNEAIYKGAPEICDYVDNDCNGMVDEGQPQLAFYRDADRDGTGDQHTPPLNRCDGFTPPGYVFEEEPLDCDDTNRDVNIFEQELCDGVDNDCDELVDKDDDNDQPLLKPIEFTDTELDCLSPEPSAPPRWTIIDCPGEPGDPDEMLWCTDRVDLGCTTEALSLDNCRRCGNECRFACGREDCDEIEAVSVSYDHSCARTHEGELACWGRGEAGRLGTDSERSSYVPSEVVGGSEAHVIATGPNSSCATIGESRALWCWGSNTDGLLGAGSSISASNYPVRVIGGLGEPTLRDVKSVGVASEHACAVRDNGELWCWGNEEHGRLGDDSTTETQRSPIPAQREDWSNVDDAASVAVGEFHGCIVTTGKTLACWGDNLFGQLGDPSFEDPMSTTVRAVPGLIDVDQVSAGSQHTCALSAGDVLCWGANGRSQLGRAPSDQDGVPSVVEGLGIITAISAGSQFTCALDDAGAVWCWGSNEHGERGEPGGDSAEPHRIDIDEPVRSVSAGGTHACAATALQTYCWGQNFFGQLGIGISSSEGLSEPQPVRPLDRQRR